MTTADASSRERGGFVTSRYNFAVPTVETAVVFNALHGSAVRLGGARALAEALAEPGVLVGEEDLPPALFLELVRSRVLVSADTDELAIVAERFHRARADAAIVVTVTTTMDCNLGCYYCYEDRSGAALDGANGDVDALVALVSATLARSGKRSLHVDWYGGEPLLNLAFLEEASLRLQALCAERGATYRASIISNGTVWPEDVGGFVARHRIGQAQVTFDGVEAAGDHAFWASFDPTRQPRCQGCSFLPICWSGCPKNHLERDTAAILEQGAYWRANLARLVATGLGLTLDGEVTYEPAQQFPDGEPAPYANA